MAFERKIKYISELEKKSSPFDLKLRNKVDELKKLIRKGKSTGDNIKDYIIVCTGKVYFNELENKLRGLDEGLKNIKINK